MFQRYAGLLCLAVLSGSTLLAQGLDTPASKTDWEEINFDFNSSVLVDGFPSLLRVAELMKKNPSYKLQVEGNTDELGANNYNQQLGLARANAVRDFLVRRGAVPASQIMTSSAAASKPKVRSSKRGYSPTDEGRFMNRRVVLTVLDKDGNKIGDACDMVQSGCCNDVLKKLDKLDEIEKLLLALVDANRGLKAELDEIRTRVNLTGTEVDRMDPRLTRVEEKIDILIARGPGGGGDGKSGTQGPPGPQGPPGASAKDIAKEVVDEHEKRNPHFELLGVNVGPTSSGDATFTGKGRFFRPIGKNFAFQSEAEYFYSKGQREGQFDFGGVERLGRFQSGLFASFKHVNLTGNQTGGTLGQAALTLDYLFKWGKVGVYGTKAFMDDALVNRTAALGANGLIVNQIYTERYLRVVDSAGITGTGPLFGKNYFEGDMGYLKSTVSGDRFGGTLRFVFPISKYPLAFTVEGGVNETLLGAGNTGRAVVGLRFGNMLRPKELLAADHAVPAIIPRVRYEVLTRTTRTGNDAPVADAGPNQAFTGATTVTLDGSRSYDPNGDPLTYLWQQDGGPTVALSSPTAAVTTFAAAAGQDYSFRLTVKDPSGALSVARVSISTGGPIILSFTATQATGSQPATLNWNVANADTVTITGIGNVAAQGSAPVTPLGSTVYQLTATRGSKTVTASVTVVPTAPVIVSFGANPASINSGQSTTLSWQTTGADVVSISTLGNVVANGSVAVSPATTTTYVLTATKGGQTATANVTVTVGGGQKPSITSFTVSQQFALAGTPLQLSCSANGATSVTVAGTTINAPSATITVTPFVNSNYICVATGAGGLTDQRQLDVFVIPTGVGGN